MNNALYSFSGYDADWMGRFDSVKKFLREVFGDRATGIEHVGSTSVPGMKAKPVIDVLVLVEKMKGLRVETERMVEAGYTMSKNHIAPDTLLFYRIGSGGEKLENIHICQSDSNSARQMLVMRDYLRTFPTKAKEYSDLKESLAQRYPNDYHSYRDAKATFLAELEREAYGWDDDTTRR